MKMYRERLGYEITREELYEKVFAAEPSKEREVFLEWGIKSMDEGLFYLILLLLPEFINIG